MITFLSINQQFKSNHVRLKLHPNHQWWQLARPSPYTSKFGSTIIEQCEVCIVVVHGAQAYKFQASIRFATLSNKHNVASQMQPPYLWTSSFDNTFVLFAWNLCMWLWVIFKSSMIVLNFSTRTLGVHISLDWVVCYIMNKVRSSSRKLVER
jgi:hypothetical protein